MYEQVINIERMEQAVSLFGSFDENTKLEIIRKSRKKRLLGKTLRLKWENAKMQK